MRAGIEALIAACAAIALHLAAFAPWPETQSSASASGAGGEELVSIEGASATIADMVEAWDTPPKTSIADPAQPVEAAAETAANLPTFNAPVAPDLAPLPPPPSPMSQPALPDMAVAATSSPPAVMEKPQPQEAQLEPEAEPQDAPKVGTAARPPARPESLSMPAPKAPPTPQPERARPARQTTAAAPTQRASGTGGGPVAGEARQAQGATVSAARLNDLKASWGGAIRSRIERRKSYPPRARGASGTSTVVLSVGRNGNLLGVGIASGSGNPHLDQAAIDAVRAAGKFPAAPPELREAEHRFTLRIRFAP